MKKVGLYSIITTLVILIGISDVMAQGIPGSEAEGRWNITIQTSDGELPSWLEIKTSGIGALVGRFVGPAGSARPISEINYSEENQTYSFSIPPQWSQSENDLHVEFTHDGNTLSGSMSGLLEEKVTWTAERAPELKHVDDPQWGKPIQLLDQDMSKWVIPENNQFHMQNGVMINKKSGGNLITKEEFQNFKLHVEFRYPEGSNSGIYLRGRYEVQIVDSYGQKPDSHLLGGVYGFIDPSVNAAKKAGEWQTYDITINGRMVNVTLNGTEVICNRPIPGITGGALDSNEGEPGPIKIQGDHGPVEFRDITITPMVN